MILLTFYAHTMEYQMFPPSARLRGVISHFWTGTWESSPKDIYVIASPLTEITFGFSDEKIGTSLLFTQLQGQTHQPSQHTVAGYTHLLGVAIYSHALPYLFQLPSSDFTSQQVSLPTLLGWEGALLEEQISEAMNIADRIALLSDFFVAKLSIAQTMNSPMLDAVKEVKACQGKVNIKAMADAYCLSQKQFKRRFHELTGLNPKMYARITRFESVVQQYEPGMSHTQLALANGYFDQAHFIHEFKSFTGFSPRQFWRLSEPSVR